MQKAIVFTALCWLVPVRCQATNISQVVAGYNRTCILTSLGDVMCWGDALATTPSVPSTAFSSPLGYHNLDTIGDNEMPYTAGFVNTQTAFASITLGGFHVCGVAGNGSVMCWGSGSWGQLGYGNTNDIGDDEYPYEAGFVDVGDNELSAVTAGQFHTCGLTTVGAVLCWGQGDTGRLGYGSFNTIGENETPGSAGFVPLGVAVVYIASGVSAQHTCALTANGSAICWGSNGFGQLGYGHTSSIGDDEYPSAAGFVNTGVALSEIHAGPIHTCGLTTAGNVMYVQSIGYNAKVQNPCSRREIGQCYEPWT
jgi:alpha-tubulin suppressor-like RCC1 family protein